MAERTRPRRGYDPRVGGGVRREDIPAEDFAGPHRSFPIVTPGDVQDAAQSVGRAGRQLPPSKAMRRRRLVKARTIAIAHRKGPAFEARLPKEWRRRA